MNSLFESADRRPNFLVVGAARSGTTALTTALAQHPSVFITDPKETHFWAHWNTNRTYSGPGDDVMMNQRLIRDPEEYVALYRNCSHPVRGDGSVSTFAYPENSVATIKQFGGDEMKFIVLLREPSSRCISSYLYLRARGYESETSFERALSLEGQRIKDGFHHMWHYRGLSQYGEALECFKQEFGERVLVLIHEEYLADREAGLRQVCQFLGIDDSFEFMAEQSVNRGGIPRSQLFTNLSNQVRRSSTATQLVKKAVPPAVLELIKEKNLKKDTLLDIPKSELFADFADTRADVVRLIGRDIPSWEA